MEFVEQFIDRIQEMNPYYLVGGSLFIYTMTKNFIKKAKLNKKQKAYIKKVLQFKQKQKQIVQQLKVPENCGIEQEIQENILTSSVCEIKQMLDQQLFTSEQLLNLYTNRILTIGKELKVYTSVCYKEALEQARYCDKLRKEGSQLCQGDLFGVVMSVKDTFDLAGYESNIGCENLIGKIPNSDGFTIQALKNAGAIIFMKTNIPQSLMAYDSYNRLYGLTRNAWNKDRSAGGSSGGEGAAIGARVSPIGLGSDIGGSIRNPSSFNGISGLKTTSQRISHQGHGSNFTDGMKGLKTIEGSIGPMGKYVEDLAQVMRTLLNSKNYEQIPTHEQDHFYTIKPWNQQLYKSEKKFKIGYFKSLDIFPASSACQRAVQESVDLLRKLGHEVVEIQFPHIESFPRYIMKIFANDNGQCLVDLLGDEEPIDECKPFVSMRGKPKFFKPFLEKMMRVFGQKRIADVLGHIETQDSSQFCNYSGQVFKLRDLVIKELSEQNIDAILSPVCPIPAGKPKYATNLGDSFIYTSMYNLINMPAGTVPVTVVKEDEQIYTDHHNDLETKACIEQMQNTAGLPIGIQIASYPMQEEICLNIMKQIETQVQFHKNHPNNN